MTYRQWLDTLTKNQLQDHIDEIWRAERPVTQDELDQLVHYLLDLYSRDPATYIMVWIVMLSQVKVTEEAQAKAEDEGRVVPLAKVRAGAAILGIFAQIPQPPDPEPEFEWVWVTKLDDRVCPICKPLHGQRFGDGIAAMGISTHPGCRCEMWKVYKGTWNRAPQVQGGIRAMQEIRIRDAGPIRAMSVGQKRILEVLAAPFGNAQRADRYKQWFDQNTNFMIKPGDRRPLLYYHGHSPTGRGLNVPYSIGDAWVDRIDEQGVWMRGELPPQGQDPLADRTWQAALENNAKASTGSVNYLVRPQPKKGIFPPGPVRTWPIAELSVFDGGDNRIPVSDDAVVIPLRALFEQHDLEMPETFEAGEDKNVNSRSKPNNKNSNEELKMDEITKAVQEALAAERAAAEAKEKERAAMRASIIEELQAERKGAKRGVFNINHIDDTQAKKDAGDEEEFAFYRSLIEDAKLVRAGGMPRGYQRLGVDPTNPDAMRTLEETEAAELGSMVPDQVANKIHDLLGKYSLVDKLQALGLMTIYNADRLTFTVPAETSAMGALDDIAEEGAYTANEMAFAAKQSTMQKVGNYLKVTEEALDDQTLFQSYLPKACAKAIALSKNADLYALLATIDGTEIATEATITDAEIVQTLYYGLAQEYREGACFFMNDETLGYVRSMLVATPRAYGEFGFAPMSMGELGERFLNHYVFTNSNWTNLSNATQDDLKIIDFVNVDEAIAWVERKGLSIFVDPYSTRLSAGVINFLPNARYGGVVVNAAACNGLDGHEA